MGHDLGTSESYWKPTEREVLEDCLKAVPLLTINGDNLILQKQVEELTEKTNNNDHLLKAKFTFVSFNACMNFSSFDNISKSGEPALALDTKSNTNEETRFGILKNNASETNSSTDIDGTSLKLLFSFSSHR